MINDVRALMYTLLTILMVASVAVSALVLGIAVREGRWEVVILSAICAMALASISWHDPNDR